MCREIHKNNTKIKQKLKLKILLTGATGYIGKRLLPILLKEGHEVICCIRDKKRFNAENYSSPRLQVIEHIT